jgi:hypothetical protein
MSVKGAVISQSCTKSCWLALKSVSAGIASTRLLLTNLPLLALDDSENIVLAEKRISSSMPTGFHGSRQYPPGKALT